MSKMDCAFEQHMLEKFGQRPEETRTLYRIATGLVPELMDALRKTPVENDMELLLQFTRIEPDIQQYIATALQRGFRLAKVARFIRSEPLTDEDSQRAFAFGAMMETMDEFTRHRIMKQLRAGYSD